LYVPELFHRSSGWNRAAGAALCGVRTVARRLMNDRTSMLKTLRDDLSKILEELQ
jgi:hypothetical protein